MDGVGLGDKERRARRERCSTTKSAIGIKYNKLLIATLLSYDHTIVSSLKECSKAYFKPRSKGKKPAKGFTPP